MRLLGLCGWADRRFDLVRQPPVGINIPAAHDNVLSGSSPRHGHRHFNDRTAEYGAGRPRLSLRFVNRRDRRYGLAGRH